MKLRYSLSMPGQIKKSLVAFWVALAACSSPAFAQAGPPATYDAFSIDYFTGTKDGVSFSPEMLLHDYSPLQVGFSLDGLQTRVATDGYYPAHQSRSMQIGISPNPGYRITKVLVAMTSEANKVIPLVFTEPGYELSNVGRVEGTFLTTFSSVLDGSTVTEPEEFNLPNVTSPVRLEHWIGAVLYGQQLVINVNVDLAVSAWPSYFRSIADPLGPQRSLPSYGRLGAEQPYLIVYSEPIGAIPEPASWTMLALGLIVLHKAGSARRS